MIGKKWVTVIRGERKARGPAVCSVHNADAYGWPRLGDDAGDASGLEFDIGELVTYFNDAVFWAPSMILGPETTWAPVAPDSFDVTLADGGRAVTARVFVDERGAPTDFSTTDRFCYDADDPKRLARARWTTPIMLEVANGRPVGARGQAMWHLPAGPKPYADFTLVPGTLAYNVAPGQ